MRIQTVIFSLHFFFAPGAMTQTTDPEFHLVEGNHGIPLRKINAIGQDKFGFMWFLGQGSASIYRYDGHQFISFTHDSTNANSLGGVALETLHVDRDGIVWIGMVEGLDRYDPATGIFTHFTHSENDPGTISGVVSSILKDSKGRLWVGTGDGLDLLNEKSGKFIHYRNDTQNPRSISNNFINKIYEDRSGTIWIGTGFPWFNLRLGEGGLNRLDADGAFTRFVHNPSDPQSLINNKVKSILEDSKGNFWVGTNTDGLHLMNRVTGKFTRLRHDPKNPDKLSRPSLTREDMNDPITFIHEDIIGNIWIGTRLSGINRYDYKTNKVTNFKKSNGFPDISGWNAFNSRDGVMWICTEDENLYRIDPAKRSPVKHDAPVINAYSEDKNGILWAATDGSGIWKFDNKINIIQKLEPGEKNAANSIDGEIRSIFDKGDSLLFGTMRGLFVLDKKTNSHSKLALDRETDSLELTPVSDIFSDKTGNIWLTKFSGPFGTPLVRYSRDFHIYKFVAEDSQTVGSVDMTCGLADQEGFLWLGGNTTKAGEAGISRCDPRTGKFKRYLFGKSVGALGIDKSGTVWVGTQRGLYKLNRKQDFFERFFDPQSEVYEVGIYSIVNDNVGDIWVSTTNSVVKIETSTGRTFIYGRKFGVMPNSLVGAAFATKEGDILVSSKTGILSFNPAAFKSKNSASELVLSSVLVNGTAFKEDGFEEVFNRDQLVLSHFQRNLTFSFSLTDYRSPELNKYFTMLQGYDTTWYESGTEKTAYYFNLVPGNYIFRVKAFDSDGTMFEKQVVIRLNLPWWKTWWAYALYIMLIGSLLYIVYRIQRNRIVVRERQRAQQIELAQAKEIEKAYHQLRNTQAQLIHSEKMASLGELTAGIAHEIQNPLNFVNNFSEINQELLADLNEGIAHGKFEEVKSIARNLIENEIKISQHGKRADSIIKSMQQHSRASSGKKEPVDVNALAEECFKLSYHGLRAKDKNFHAELKSDLSPAIEKLMIVPQDIGRVLLNIFNNAFFAVNFKSNERKKNGTDYGSAIADNGYLPTVWLRTFEENGMVKISVRDNGNGISEKVIDKIFQPFFTTKPTGEGTGLGLSLSYDIVKAHGGEIYVINMPGEGAEFVVSIPGG